MRPDAASRAERGVLVAVALGAVLAPLNSTMIAVALPRIVDDFDASIGTAGWLITAYLLALAVVQPVAGKLGDRFGRRPFVLGGLAVFGLASLGAAAAPSLGLLIACRVCQAVAGAVVFPNGAGLVREVVPMERRGAAFGVVGAALSLAAALGPPLGGLLVAAGGWQWIFYVNVPLVAAALGVAWWAVPRREARPSVAAPFDRLGAALFALLLGGAAALVIESRHAGSTTVAAGGVALVATAVWFLHRELHHPDPVVQPRFFARRGFSAASAGVAFSNLGFYTTLVAIPILLERSEGWTSLRTGLALMLLSAPMVALSPVGGRLADRLGRRRPSVAGCALLAAALVPLALAPGLETAWLLVALGLAGAGVGLASAGMQASAVEAVDARESGAAAGLYSTSRYVGSFAGSIALARLLDGGVGLDGFGAVFALALAGAALSVVAALGLHPRRGTPRAAPRSPATASVARESTDQLRSGARPAAGRAPQSNAGSGRRPTWR